MSAGTLFAATFAGAFVAGLMLLVMFYGVRDLSRGEQTGSAYFMAIFPFAAALLAMFVITS